MHRYRQQKGDNRRRREEGTVGQGVKYMAAEGKYTVGGEHTIENADVKLKCCTPENCY